METLYPASEHAGQRLDVFLSAALPEISRSAAARLIETGQVLCGGKCLPKSYRIAGGEEITVTLPQPEPIDAQPEDLPLHIVYEDEDVVVVNKPSGMVVHPAPGHAGGTLVNALLYHCGSSLSGVGGAVRPGIVHRIDRDTSGLIIAAKNDAAHLGLAKQLSDHSLARTYEAVVMGHLREDSGTVDAPIGRHPRDRKKMAVVPGGRPAVTHYEVIERYRSCTYVRCRLETGRTHQIRVHMAHLGHPVYGDPLYGTARSEVTGQCLHAAELTFLHPRTGERMTLVCPLPEEFQSLLEKLRRMG